MAEEQPSFLDDVHRDIVEFASRHFDKDEDRSAFVDEFLEHHGYQRQSVWARPVPKSGPAPGSKSKSYFKSH